MPAAPTIPGFDRPAPRRRLGIALGLLVALALHALLLLACLRLTLAPAPAELPPIAITLLAPPPLPPAPPAGAGEAEPKVEVPAPEPEPIVQAKVPRIVRATPRRRAKATPRRGAAQPAAPARPSGEAGGVEGGVQAGTAGGARDGKPGGVAGGSGDGPVPAEKVASPPALLSQVRPAYPAVARARGIEGLVVVELIVDRGGRVEPDSVHVKASIAALDAAAVEAVRRWRFRPGRDAGGEAVRVLLEVPIRFQLR